MSKEIGARIRKLREAKEFVQLDMASKLDLTPGAYAKIERGETDPSASRLFQIAAILKVDVMVLLKDDAPKEISKKESGITRQEFDNLVTQVSSNTEDLKKLISKSGSFKKSPQRKK